MMHSELIFKGDRTYITLVTTMIEKLVELFVGLWLALGSKGLVKAMKFLRTAGVRQPEEKDTLL